MDLQPNPGFEWSAVMWGAPDEVVADVCSYCGDQLDEESVPLTLWDEEGWTACFCEHCMVRWWNMG